MRNVFFSTLLALAACPPGAKQEDAGPDGGPCAGEPDCEGRICDLATLTCVDCLDANDCPASQPGCDHGACGGCEQSSDCPGGETCVAGACTCSSDAQCPSATPGCLADGGPGVCGCVGAGGCAGSAAVCDPAQGIAGVCVPACTSAGCTADGGPAFCDPESGLCVECLQTTQCTDDEPVCVAGRCTQCDADSDCTAADAGYCSLPLGGLCVACTAASQCPASRPGCNSADGSCGSCFRNADCPPGLGCATNGLCAFFCGTAAAGSSLDCAACHVAADCGDAGCNLDAGTCG